MTTKYSAPPALIKFLKPYDREIRELALLLRALLLEEIGPCYENIYVLTARWRLVTARAIV
jgi:hypothetical protein